MEIIGLLESAIGLVLIYLVLSLICSAWVEAIVNWTGLRGENLRKLIEVLCAGDRGMAHMLLAHPHLRSLYASADHGASATGWKRVRNLVQYVFKRVLALFFDRGESHKKSGFRPPSYIPPERFARALADMALGDSVERLRETPGLIEQGLSEPRILDQLEKYKSQIQRDAQNKVVPIRPEHCLPGANCLENSASHLSKVLTRLWHQSGGDADRFLKAIQTWFEDANDRAIGWFKRKLSPKLFAVGILVAFVLNVDTLHILSQLSEDPTTREALMQMAVDRVEQPDGAPGEGEAPVDPDFERAKRELLSIEPLMGWRLSSLPEPVQLLLVDDAGGAGSREDSDEPASESGAETNGSDESTPEGQALSRRAILVSALWLLMKLSGLMITAIALSLGAPFWFDVLRKLLKVRESITKAAPDARDSQRSGGGAAGRAAAGPESSDDAAAQGRGEDPTARLATGLAGLAPDASAPDRTNARWMAELANLAYASESAARDRLQTLGLQLELWLDTRNKGPESKFGDTDTQAFIAVSRDLIVVAFRGTEPADAGDVLTDLKARMTPIAWFSDPDARAKQGSAPPPSAHRGFQAALDAVWSEVEKRLRALGPQMPGRRVWFTGHSLGGALAVLAAARYSILRERYNREREARLAALMNNAEQGDKSAKKELDALLKQEPGPLPACGEIHTIGQPAVGDERLAQWLSGRFGRRMVRTVNNRDAVPRLPTPALGYVHSGAELYFDSFGRMKLNPGGWYRGLDALALDPDRIRDQVLEAAGDHSAAAYIELLKGRSSISV